MSELGYSLVGPLNTLKLLISLSSLNLLVHLLNGGQSLLENLLQLRIWSAPLRDLTIRQIAVQGHEIHPVLANKVCNNFDLLCRRAHLEGGCHLKHTANPSYVVLSVGRKHRAERLEGVAELVGPLSRLTEPLNAYSEVSLSLEDFLLGSGREVFPKLSGLGPPAGRGFLNRTLSGGWRLSTLLRRRYRALPL